MDTKQFGSGAYQIMPINDIELCEQVFKSWIAEATEDKFPARLCELYNVILDVTTRENVANESAFSINKTVAKNVYSFNRTEPDLKETYTDTVSMCSDDFGMIASSTMINGQVNIKYIVTLETGGRRSIIEASGTDIEKLEITHFIPGPWIYKFYGLADEIELLNDPELMATHNKIAELKDKFSDFGIFKADYDNM